MNKYVFGKGEEVTFRELRALGPVHRQQAIAAIEAYVGGSYNDIDDCMAGLRKQLGMDPEEFGLTLYTITREGDAEPSFEMWTVATDNGLVFPIGEDQGTAVHCAQSNFWSVDDDDKEAIALAEALNAVVPF